MVQLMSRGATLIRGAAQPRSNGAAAVGATVQVLTSTPALYGGAAQWASAG